MAAGRHLDFTKMLIMLVISLLYITAFLSVPTLLGVDVVQKQQILMQKTQQFIKSVKGV